MAKIDTFGDTKFNYGYKFLFVFLNFFFRLPKEASLLGLLAGACGLSKQGRDAYCLRAVVNVGANGSIIL